MESYAVEGHTYIPVGMVCGLALEWHLQLRILAKILANCNDARPFRGLFEPFQSVARLIVEGNVCKRSGEPTEAVDSRYL